MNRRFAALAALALPLLISACASVGGPTVRIEVDVEGYRARRAESLVSTARRMAEKVRETGRPATVDLMNPRDRRIVHMALKDEGGVTSRSQGDGFLRKLIILPAGKRRNGPRSARDGE